MAINEIQFKQFRKQAEDARGARDKAAGQLEADMGRLKDDFGCGTVKAATKLHTKLKQEAMEAEATYDEAVLEFEEQQGEHLEDE